MSDGPSVRHVLVLYLNEYTYRYTFHHLQGHNPNFLSATSVKNLKENSLSGGIKYTGV